MADEFEGKIDAEGKFELTRPFWEALGETFAVPQVSSRLAKALEKKKVLDWYDIRDYPLDVARNDEFITGFQIRGGDCLLVLSITKGATAQIKFDSTSSATFSFELADYRKLRHNFNDLYLSNAAQVGATLHLLFGRGDWEVVRHHPEEEIMAINADTVDGLHASASIEAGKLLALGPDGFFPCGAVRCLQNELLANQPAAPATGDVFISRDTGELYICFTAGVWTNLNAAQIPFTPAGGLVATDVQAAIEEVMADLNGFPDELKNLTIAEIGQVENINLVTITNAQWGYLGACGAGGGQLMAALTAAESTQLENIGLTTISATQWGALGALVEWTAWVPNLTNDADLSGYNIARYYRIGDLCFFHFTAEAKNVTTPGAGIDISLPFTAANTGYFVVAITLNDGTNDIGFPTNYITPNTAYLKVTKSPAGGAWGGAEAGIFLRVCGFFEIA